MNRRTTCAFYRMWILVLAVTTLADLKVSAQRHHTANAPQILEQPSNITVLNGSPAVLYCRVAGNPQPTITWWRLSGENAADDDSAAAADRRFKEIRGQHYSVLYDESKTRSVLRIDQVRRRHAGTYRCQAALDITASPPTAIATAAASPVHSQSATISVLDDKQTTALRGSFPRAFIGDGPTKSVELNRQQDVVIPCDVDGDAPLTVRWLKDSVPLDVSGSNRRIGLIGSGSLKILNVERGDGGHYECMVSNALGTSFSGRLRLDVVLRRVFPYFVNEPPKQIDTHLGEHVRVPCSANGSPFPYVTWHRADDQHATMEPANLFESVLTIPSARQSATYTCRVQSELGFISASTNIRLTSSSSDSIDGSGASGALPTTKAMETHFSFSPSSSFHDDNTVSTLLPSMNAKISARPKLGPSPHSDGGDDEPTVPVARSTGMVKAPRRLRVVSIGERSAVLIWDGRTYEQVVDYFTIYYQALTAATVAGGSNVAAAAAAAVSLTTTQPLQYIPHITAQRHELTGLEPGTTYEAYVLAEHLGHVSEPSAPRVTFETMKNGAPGDVRAHAVSSTAVRVNWWPSLVQGKSLRGYDVYIAPTTALSDEPSSAPTDGVEGVEEPEQEERQRWRKQSVSVRDTATILTGLAPRTFYTVKVRPIFWPEIPGPFSNAVVVETQQGAPGQPRDVTVQLLTSSSTTNNNNNNVGVADVQVSWKPPASDAGILRYDVHISNVTLSATVTGEKSTVGGDVLIKSVGSHSTSLTVASIATHSKYEFRVVAIGRDGSGLPSKSVFIDLQSKSRPNIVNNDNKDNEWVSAASIGEARPERRPHILAAQPVSATALNVSWYVNDTSSSPPSPSSFKIYAQVVDHSSSSSANDNEQQQEKKLSVKMFSFSSDDIVANVSGAFVDDSVKRTEFWKVIDGLQEWSKHNVWVVAVDAATGNESEQSKMITARTLESVPGPPQNIRHTIINTTAFDVMWDPPIEPQRSNIHYYLILYKLDDADNIAAAATHQIGPVRVPGERRATVIGAAGRRYRVQVAAFSTNNNAGERSEPVLVTVPKVRAPAPHLTLTFDPLQLQAHLTWRTAALLAERLTGFVLVYGPATADNQNTTINVMKLMERRADNEISDDNVVVDELRRKRLQPYDREMLIGGLERGRHYAFHIAAAVAAAGHNSAEKEILSEISSQTLIIPESAPDGPPTNIRYQFDQQSVLTFFWDPPKPALRNGQISHYELEVLEQDRAGNIQAALRQAITNATHLVHSKLRKHSRYLFKVAAATSAGLGPFSQIVHVDVPLEVPKPPNNIVATAVNATAIEVWWAPMERPALLPLIDNNAKLFSTPAPQLAITGFKVYSSLVQPLHSSSTAAAAEVATRTPNTSGWNTLSVPADAWRARLGGLQPNATYSIVVAAQTDTVTGYLSQPIQVPLRPTIVPHDFRATLVASHYVRLEWLPPPPPIDSTGNDDDPNGLGISYYKIACEGTRSFIDQNGVQQTPKVPPCAEVNISNATSATISHLVPFTDYKFSLSAIPVRQPSYLPAVLIYVKTLPEVPDVVAVPEPLQRLAYDMYSVRLRRCSNKRGSVAHYWLIVMPLSSSDGDLNGTSNEELLLNSNETTSKQQRGVKPYVAAQLTSENFGANDAFLTFPLGDSRVSGGFVNRALTTSLSYRMFLRVFVRQESLSPSVVNVISKDSGLSVAFSTGDHVLHDNSSRAAATAAAAAAAGGGDSSTALLFASFGLSSFTTLLIVLAVGIVVCAFAACVLYRKWKRGHTNVKQAKKMANSTAAANGKKHKPFQELLRDDSQNLLTAGAPNNKTTSSTFVGGALNGNGNYTTTIVPTVYANPHSNGYGSHLHHHHQPLNGGTHLALPVVIAAGDTNNEQQQQQQHRFDHHHHQPPSPLSVRTPSANSMLLLEGSSTNHRNGNHHLHHHPYLLDRPHHQHAAAPAAGSCSASGSTQSTNVGGADHVPPPPLFPQQLQIGIDNDDDTDDNEEVDNNDLFVRRLLLMRHTQPDPLEQWRSTSTVMSAALSNYAPISRKHLSSYAKHCRAQPNGVGGGGGFGAEFQCVETTRAFTWLASTLDINQQKNRYNNIVAYDHSRVILYSSGGGTSDDYINANFCDGYRQRSAYIATQGPMANTVHDFWRMIWQQKSTSIVMLTKLEERMRAKCAQYWPQRVGISETYAPSSGDHEEALRVTLESIDHYAFYVIRKLTVRQSVNIIPVRTVWHYQFTAWPDHGVPHDATPFLMFVRRIQRAVAANDEEDYMAPGPLVVHCSAGVGRTGAFIVTDIMLKRLYAREPQLDIFGCVCMLREQRNFMIQTDEQYGFVYDAVVEADAVLHGLSDMSLQQFMQWLESRRSSQRARDISFQRHFSRLRKPSAEQQRRAAERALAPANKYKNRDLTTLPYDANAVYPATDGANDYINASFIDGYRLKRAYIATQLPLRTTTSDFWRMVCEQNCNIVVVLVSEEELTTPHESSSCCYWPTDMSTRFEPYVVSPVAEYNLTCYILREFSVFDPRDGCSRTVRQFQYSSWNERKLPHSTESFIEFIGHVHKTKEQFGVDGPIIVHCMTGAGRTGSFIALSTIIERAQYEKRIDVFSTAQLMLMQRANSIENSEQYEFLHQASGHYIQLYESN